MSDREVLGQALASTAIYVAVRPIMSSSVSLEPVLEAHVRLILLAGAEPFYLEIPMAVIDPLCLKPLKYLVFLGWCILGVDGHLAVDGDDEVGTDGVLNAGETYFYVTSVKKATGGFF